MASTTETTTQDTLISNTAECDCCCCPSGDCGSCPGCETSTGAGTEPCC